MTSERDPYREWDRRAWLATGLLLVTIVVLIISYANGCMGGPRKNVTETPPAPPPPVVGPPALPPPCGEMALGDTKSEACEGGQKIFVCTSRGLIEAAQSCKALPQPGDDCEVGVATFKAVQPTLTRSCTGCHPGYDRIETARVKIDEILRRITLPIGDPQHMPKGGDLTGQEKSLLNGWKADGLCGDPDVPPIPPTPPTRLTLEILEQKLTDDLLTNVAVNRRKTTRYLTGVGKELAAFRAVGEKALNSVSLDRFIRRTQVVSPGVWRFDLEDVRFDARSWALVENADLVDLESFTSRGIVLKALTGTRKPWLASDSFADAALRNSTVYYTLLRVPQTFAELTARLGVQYAGDLQNFEALTGAFVGSPLSPHNRLVSRHRSSDGVLLVTYDTGALDAAEKNFFEFPCLGDVGCQRNAKFVAGETIFTLPNQLHGYGLFSAKQTFLRGRFSRSDLDRRLDVADVGVVRDVESPISSEIRAGNSCLRCHHAGVLAFRDQLRDHVTTNGSEFGNDKDLILAVFRGNSEWSESFGTDSAGYATALSALGIDPRAADPISVATDRYLGPWTFDMLAERLLLAPEDFRVLVNQSATARRQVGQLVSGGTITFDQVVQSLPVLKRELRLLQDPLSVAIEPGSTADGDVE